MTLESEYERLYSREPGPLIIDGKLFFRLLDGSLISCHCIGRPYSEEIVQLWRGSYKDYRDVGHTKFDATVLSFAVKHPWWALWLSVIVGLPLGLVIISCIR